MNAVIVYSGKYGSTRQYAQWISEELSAPIMSVKEAKEKDLAGADTIILGSSVMVDSLSMKGWIKARWPLLKEKRVILFSVSATSPADEPAVKGILEHSMTPEMISHMRFFPLHGRLIIANLPLLLRPLIKAIMKSEKGSDSGAGMTGEFDGVKRENIEPIIKAARSG
jgi:menaquinone-dependent protoporphyrinogen IX oxidase